MGEGQGQVIVLIPHMRALEAQRGEGAFTCSHKSWLAGI